MLVEECCNAPDSLRQVSASYSSLLPCHLLACCISSCHHVHFILHACSSHASEHFPRCPFCNPALLCPPVVISSFLSCVGIKRFRIGPRLAKRPLFTTGRPPVKFRTIWTLFDTPTVNRGTEKASCVLQQTLLQTAQIPSKSLPCSRSFDHDRVGENCAPFGVS